MGKSNILIQLDPDPQPSSFDRIVAIDSGADHVLAHGDVTEDQVESLVHGAMFTRGPRDLHHTAIFVGGSNVARGEAILKKVTSTFFGPLSVSVMLDANGANTTAAAAVLTAAKYLDLSNVQTLVLGGTGPVGQRVARLLAGKGASVRLASRTIDKASAAAQAVNQVVACDLVSPCQTGSEDELGAALDRIELVVSCGAAGIQLLPAVARQSCKSLKVAIDLNAVPPAGIEGVDITDKGKEQDGIVMYGAIGVGGAKMKIHKAAIARLFESNNQILDAESIYSLGEVILSG